MEILFKERNIKERETVISFSSKKPIEEEFTHSGADAITLQLSTMDVWWQCQEDPWKYWEYVTLLHSERPKLYAILAILSAIGLNKNLP